MDSQVRIDWEVPGPGYWELDRSHFHGGTTPLVQELAEYSMEHGMREVMQELGAPLDSVQFRFVKGFCYTRTRPLIGADKPSTKLPPLPVLKLAMRVHPEMRRRAKRADTVLRDRPWRAVVAEWESTGRHEVESKNLALQDVDLAALSDLELVRHVREVIAHNHRMWAKHFWLHGFDLGPIGLLLVTCQDIGVPFSEAIPLLEGASPSTTAPIDALARVRAAVEASGHEPASLDDLRSISPDVAADIDTYLRYRGSLLFSRYDIQGYTLGERPDLVLATIMSGQARVEGTSVDERTQAVREAIDPTHRAEFDERLAEARAAMNLRDDNGPTCGEWPLGLMRLSLLEVGRRMVARGFATRPEAALEVTSGEVSTDLLDGTGPSAAALDARTARRLEMSRLEAPESLGPPEPAPPLEVLPDGMGRLVRVVQTVLQQLGAAGDRAELGAGLKGSGVGHATYRGTARRAGSPEEALDMMEPGDILVVPFTTPAYNVVLSIAGAIVTAVGGPLSHAAVLARELGIPAVIGAPNALLDIEDGAEIEVDPIAGEVRVIVGV